MYITVRLFATFRIGRFTEKKEAFADGTRISDVIRALDIPETQVGMIMLDNKYAAPEQLLSDGSNLSLFPFVGGGCDQQLGSGYADIF